MMLSIRMRVVAAEASAHSLRPLQIAASATQTAAADATRGAGRVGSRSRKSPQPGMQNKRTAARRSLRRLRMDTKSCTPASGFGFRVSFDELANDQRIRPGTALLEGRGDEAVGGVFLGREDDARIE